MTAIQLHPAPAWSRVAHEQVRAVGLRLRSAGIMLLALFTLIAMATIVISLDTFTPVRGGRPGFNATFAPQMTVVLTLLAMLTPLMVWEGEDPTRRLYHRAMPVGQLTHALAKVVGGWAWVVVATAVYVIGIAIVPVLVHRGSESVIYSPTFLWWHWLVPFTSVTIAYALASSAGVGTRQPFVWIFGSMVIYGGVIALLMRADVPMLTDVARAMTTAITGTYGLGAATTGNIDGIDVSGRLVTTALERWLGATSIWGAASAALFYLVARRRVETV